MNSKYTPDRMDYFTGLILNATLANNSLSNLTDVGSDRELAEDAARLAMRTIDAIEDAKTRYNNYDMHRYTIPGSTTY